MVKDKHAQAWAQDEKFLEALFWVNSTYVSSLFFFFTFENPIIHHQDEETLVSSQWDVCIYLYLVWSQIPAVLGDAQS